MAAVGAKEPPGERPLASADHLPAATGVAVQSVTPLLIGGMRGAAWRSRALFAEVRDIGGAIAEEFGQHRQT
jgi:hypothetical protein